MRRSACFAALVVVVVAGACGGAPEPSPSCTDPEPATSIALADFEFQPGCIGAAPGATLVIENTGAAPHTFSVDPVDVDVDLTAGASSELSLAGIDPGAYAVTCRYHPQMTATLVVG